MMHRVLNRRTLLAACVAGTLSACRGGSPTPGAAPSRMPTGAAYRELTADQQAIHAVSRLTFGARPGQIEQVRAQGVDRWIDDQLHPERIDDAAVTAFFASYESYHSSADALDEKYPRPATLFAQIAKNSGTVPTKADSMRVRDLQVAQRRLVTELQSGRVARALLTERQLNEVMTDFWLNHFSVYVQKGQPEHYMLASYENDVIRPNALGKFRTLLGAVAKSPAMLFYLDNWESQVDSARPRLNAQGRPIPSFTPAQAQRLVDQRQRAGLPMPAGVTTQNVQQVVTAQRRRGLNENYGRELLELHTLGVDGGYTQDDVINAARALTGWTLVKPPVSEFTFRPQLHDAGEKVLLGHRLAAGRGLEDGEEVLDIVARHPATAHYIAFKLARRFVSDTPSTDLVNRAAETFTRTDGDIREVLRTIITSPEFFARSATRTKVKTPFEVVVSTLRAVNAQPDSTPRTAAQVAFLGQPIYGHQTPNGWPETADQWMNTGSILNRINFGVAVAANRVPGASALGWPGADALKNAPLEQQVDGVIRAFLAGDASTVTRAVLTSGENPLAKHSTMMAPPKGLPQIVGLAIGSPEFQRR